MIKNPFIWFQIKMIKRHPIMSIFNFFIIMCLSFYIKDYFLFCILSLFITIQMNVLLNISYFFSIHNEIIFAAPYNVKSFIKNQTISIWTQSGLVFVFGFFINMIFNKSNIIYNFVVFIFILLLLYYLILCILLFAVITKEKYKKFVIFISLILSISLLKILSEFLNSHMLAIIIIVFLLFIISFVTLSRVSFEKIIRGEMKK